MVSDSGLLLFSLAERFSCAGTEAAVVRTVDGGFDFELAGTGVAAGGR